MEGYTSTPDLGSLQSSYRHGTAQQCLICALPPASLTLKFVHQPYRRQHTFFPAPTPGPEAAGAAAASPGGARHCNRSSSSSSVRCSGLPAAAAGSSSAVGRCTAAVGRCCREQRCHAQSAALPASRPAGNGRRKGCCLHSPRCVA